MRVAVLGASGSIGREVVERAREAGHDLTLLVRDRARLSELRRDERVVEADMTDARGIDDAVRGNEAVINALAPSSNDRVEVERAEVFARALIEAMQRHRVRRLVTLSGGAVTIGAERKPLSDRFASAIVRLLAGNVVRARQREYEIIAASDLDWIAIRPPGVTGGRFTGRYRSGDIALRPGSRISRADLAHFMVAQLEDDRFLRQAPFISY